MAVSAASGSGTIENFLKQNTTPKEARKVGEMGKDQFLNLLVTQLRYQDPMKPTDDKEFIGQMAQFSALEQMKNLNASFSSVQGTNILGKQIKATITDATTKQTKDVNGIVTDVKISKDGVVAVVGGQDVAMENISSVTQNGASGDQQDVSKYTGLIGFDVKGIYTDENNYNLPITGMVKEITKGPKSEMAVVDKAQISITDFVSPTKMVTAEDKQTYLNSQVGKDLTIVSKDDTGKNYMKLTGKLESATVDSTGAITVTMGNLKIPVKSVESVTVLPAI